VQRFGRALVRTLRDISRLSVYNTTFMSEFFEPFRIKLLVINKKRTSMKKTRLLQSAEKDLENKDSLPNNYIFNELYKIFVELL
jgi:hypothetical protein